MNRPVTLRQIEASLPKDTETRTCIKLVTKKPFTAADIAALLPSEQSSSLWRCESADCCSIIFKTESVAEARLLLNHVRRALLQRGAAAMGVANLCDSEVFEQSLTPSRFEADPSRYFQLRPRSESSVKDIEKAREIVSRIAK